MNSFLVATPTHTHTHSLLSLSLLFGSCCASSWQLPGWLNYDTPRIMRGRARVRDGKDGVGEVEGGRFRKFHSLFAVTMNSHSFQCVFLSPLIYPSSSTLSLSLFLFCCWMLRSWGKLTIMTRLIVAYFVISWSLFSECVISEQLISLRCLLLTPSHSFSQSLLIESLLILLRE